jgi:hypothetical protein
MIKMKKSTKITVSLFVILFSIVTAKDSNKPEPAQFHVGVILNLDTTVGKMAQTSIAMAVEDFYAVHSNYSTSLVLHTKDAKQDDVEATFAGNCLPQEFPLLNLNTSSDALGKKKKRKRKRYTVGKKDRLI